MVSSDNILSKSKDTLESVNADSLINELDKSEQIMIESVDRQSRIHGPINDACSSIER